MQDGEGIRDLDLMETTGFGDGEGMSGVQEEPVENRGLGGKNWGAEARAEHMET